MLDLTDPLWEKLDTAFGDQDVPNLLSELAETWDEESANSLFWERLTHQGTCYGATYAAVPHLLEIAERDENGRQRAEIAIFLGYVALCALEHAQGATLPRLPETLDEWDRKRDCYRILVARFQDPGERSSTYQQTELLPRFKRLLAVKPVDAADLEKIRSIKAEFFLAQSRIAALCKRALLEHLGDDDPALYLLSGVAAAHGQLSTARLLHSGVEGLLKCSACVWEYHYMVFGDRVAIYAETSIEPVRPAVSCRMMEDYKERAPSRSDGFVIPAEDAEICDAGAADLLSLADRVPDPEPARLLRNFLGHILCCKCGARSRVLAA